MKTNNDNREYAYKGSTINGFAMLAICDAGGDIEYVAARGLCLAICGYFSAE